MMKRPETQYTRCGDISLAYQVIGEGPFDLLYAHGWISNIEYAWESPHYARFLTKLGQFSRLIFFDRRGTGMSDREVGAPTLEQRTEDIEAVLDAVGSERAALFGVSEGGSMASLFAATHPERVSALLLFGCYARAAWAEDYPWGTPKEAVDDYVAALLANWGKPFDLSDGAPSVANDPAVRDWFAAYLRFSASPTAAERVTRLSFEIDIRDVLPAIQSPTLVLHREGDRWHSVEEAQYLAERIPGADLRVLPGEDHLPWYGDQDRLLGEMQEFLTGSRTPAAVERALLTVLMTDIAGSTTALSGMGDDRWRGLLEQLDGKVGRRVAELGGEMIKHTGDGYMLAFPGPSRAIECARALARDAAALGLQIRTGVHTGECERRGDDLSGLAVHIAARIMDEAEPGAILASRTVRDLAAGSGVEFCSVGEKELRGVPDRWEVFGIAG